jgi:glutamine cyclotransferase
LAKFIIYVCAWIFISEYSWWLKIKNKKIIWNIVYALIVLFTINGALAETIPSVKLTDTNAISYLNIFNYNTSVHNNLTGLQGGTAPNEYYHLNSAEYILVTTILSNISFDLGMLNLTEGYIYVGNSSNNPEGISSADFISGFNIGNFTAWDYSDLLNKSSDTYVVTEADPVFSAWDYSDLLNKSSDTYVVTEADPVWLSDKGNYSTTAEADLLYAPVGYGDGWNKTYADALYSKYQFLNNNFNGSGNFTTTGTGKFSYFEIPEITTIINASANAIKLFSIDDQGFSVLETITDLGIRNRINQDIYRIAKNVQGVTILKGKAVYIFSGTGDKTNIKLAKANSETTMPSIAITTADIPDNAFGEIMIIGMISGLKTDYAGWDDGDILYISPTTAGELTTIRPTHPNLAQLVGSIEYADNDEGRILVNIQDLTGVEDGTNRDNYTIGNTLSGNKSLLFDGVTDSSIIWDGSKFNFNHNISAPYFVGNGSLLTGMTYVNLTENDVEGYIFDNDNTDNFNMSSYNITMGNAVLYSNTTCFVIKFKTTLLELCE